MEGGPLSSKALAGVMVPPRVLGLSKELRLHMKYRHVLLYAVRGLQSTSIDNETVLVDETQPAVRAALVRSPDLHTAIIDRGLAVVTLMLSAFTGRSRTGEVPEQIAAEITDVQARTKKRLGTSAALVVRIEGAVKPDLTGVQREFDDYVTVFDAIDKDAIKAQDAIFVSSVVASLALAIGRSEPVEKLRDGIHLIDHAGKIYHSITPTAGSVSPMVSSLVSDTVLEATRTLVAAALGRSSLHGSLRLFVQSLEPDNDRLRSFLAAWNSIEIFVNKTFADYEAALMAKIKEGGDSPGLDRYLSRIVEVMKPRYRLADKFALLAHSLDSNAVETDLQDFTEIKAIRDRLIHGEDIPDSELPLHKAQELLRRYLEIHLLSEGA